MVIPGHIADGGIPPLMITGYVLIGLALLVEIPVMLNNLNSWSNFNKYIELYCKENPNGARDELNRMIIDC